MKKCPPDDKSLDLATIEFLHSAYRSNISKSQNEMFDEIIQPIKKIYEDCGVTSLFDNGGFTVITNPIKSRTFYFTPNPHENCEKCIEKGDNKCIPLRNPAKHYCPEYGLTIVSSSMEDDFSFTLQGVSNTRQANLNMSLSAFTYWTQKDSTGELRKIL